MDKIISKWRNVTWRKRNRISYKLWLLTLAMHILYINIHAIIETSLPTFLPMSEVNGVKRWKWKTETNHFRTLLRKNVVCIIEQWWGVLQWKFDLPTDFTWLPFNFTTKALLAFNLNRKVGKTKSNQSHVYHYSRTRQYSSSFNIFSSQLQHSTRFDLQNRTP